MACSRSKPRSTGPRAASTWKCSIRASSGSEELFASGSQRVDVTVSARQSIYVRRGPMAAACPGVRGPGDEPGQDRRRLRAGQRNGWQRPLRFFAGRRAPGPINGVEYRSTGPWSTRRARRAGRVGHGELAGSRDGRPLRPGAELSGRATRPWPMRRRSGSMGAAERHRAPDDSPAMTADRRRPDPIDRVVLRSGSSRKSMPTRGPAASPGRPL